MPFPFDKYPWLNFQELNLAYFIKHFREIFEQWDTLLHEMYDWKDATDAELAEWKSTVEAGISSWETGLQQSMEDWKDATEADISEWEGATLTALDTWKSATTAVFEQIRTEAAASATAAAGSASSAQTALAGAQAAQAAAEAAAAGIQSELTQIQTNTADIADLKTQIDNLDNGIHIIPLDLTIRPNTRFVSQYFYISNTVLPINFNCDNNAYSYYIGFYKSDDTFISTTAWQKGAFSVIETNIPADSAYFVMTCKADDEHNLTDAEKEYFSCYNKYAFYEEIEDISKRISTLFVDGTNGNDGNDGKSTNSPLKTITKALTLNPKEILVKKGTYSERLNLTGIHGLKIAPYDYGTFSTSDYDDKIILDGINTRPFLMVLDDCSDITLIGIKTVNFTNSGIKMTDCTNIKCVNCESGNQYGDYQYGIGFELINTDGEFSDCYAHDVTLDGFNIHGYGVTKFINCVAYNCGDDGISHHDACVGYISGGEYSYCGKGGISSPTYGAYINIDGAYCHNNLYGIYAVASVTTRPSKALISNCVMKNNTGKDFYIDYSTVTAWNNIYDSKTVGSKATLTEF